MGVSTSKYNHDQLISIFPRRSRLNTREFLWRCWAFLLTQSAASGQYCFEVIFGNSKEWLTRVGPECDASQGAGTLGISWLSLAGQASPQGGHEACGASAWLQLCVLPGYSPRSPNTKMNFRELDDLFMRVQEEPSYRCARESRLLTVGRR